MWRVSADCKGGAVFDWRLSQEEYDRLNPPPLLWIRDDETDLPFVEALGPEEWLFVGHVPTPKTRLAWFWHHLFHGLMMRYPAWKVLLYALQNTRMEEQP